MSKLDLDYFENVLMYKSLTDGTYLASIADFIKPDYFKNKAIASIFAIIKDFSENEISYLQQLKLSLILFLMNKKVPLKN